MGLSHVGRVRGNFEIIFAKGEFDRVGFLAGEQCYPTYGVQEELPFQGDPLFGIGRDDLAIVRIISLDHFGRDFCIPKGKENLVL